MANNKLRATKDYENHSFDALLDFLDPISPEKRQRFISNFVSTQNNN
jgi:hypothetical protein